MPPAEGAAKIQQRVLHRKWGLFRCEFLSIMQIRSENGKGGGGTRASRIVLRLRAFYDLVVFCRKWKTERIELFALIFHFL